MKILATACLLIATTGFAQATPGKISLALVEHPGSLSIDQGNWKPTEYSAKPSGSEFGVRAEDGDLHLLAFLFLVPEMKTMTAASCRDGALAAENDKALGPVGKLSMKSTSGVDIALALLIPKDGSYSALRAFVASGDLCGDILFSLHRPIDQQQLPQVTVKKMLMALQFDPSAKPTFNGAFAYATVEFDHQQYAGAAKAYRKALSLVVESDDPMKWTRVTTDQLSMSLGISGDLKQSREVNEAAIKADPTYPLYYYNLACADGEEGKAAAARTHLQQAFDRKANTLPGETLPDPATDDSFKKLISDPQFRAFVQTLSPSKP